MGAARTLDDVVTFLAARDRSEPAVAPEMRSQVYAGDPGRGVVILLHGLTASPPAWRAVAEALHAHGRTVVVARLLLHGHADRMTDVLRDLRPEALIDDIAEIIREVAQLGEEVTVVGHSLGATLALDAASRETPVARIVAVAPFLGIANVPHETTGVLMRALRKLPNVFLWWDPVMKDRLMPAHGYPRYPLAAIYAGLAIAEGAHVSARSAPNAANIDIVINDGESSVNNRTAQRLAAAWRDNGGSVAVHRLRGLGWSHDIIEPARPPAQRAFETLLAIIESTHAPDDHDHDIAAD